MKENIKTETLVVLTIIIIGAVFLVLGFTDKTNYKNSGEYYGQDKKYDRQYDECIPDPVWGGCL